MPALLVIVSGNKLPKILAEISSPDVFKSRLTVAEPDLSGATLQCCGLWCPKLQAELFLLYSLALTRGVREAIVSTIHDVWYLPAVRGFEAGQWVG